MNSKVYLKKNEEGHSNNNNNNDKTKHSTECITEKNKKSDSESIKNNTDFLKIAHKLVDSTQTMNGSLQPNPHPLLIANAIDNNINNSSNKGTDSLHFNDQDEQSTNNHFPKSSDRFSSQYSHSNCNQNQNTERLPFNFKGKSFRDCNQMKYKRYNTIFYNGISNNIDRDTPEYQCHAAELLKFLSSLWMTRTMCDLALKIENRKYLAHRLGLAMFSRKYREEFNKELKSDDGIYTIKLEHTTDAALEAILKYIYTAEIDINPANADEILSGAKELGVDNLICMATDYLNSLSIGDILIFMANVFDKDGGDLITYQIYSYIMKNLNKISRTPEYGRVSICAVKSILGDSNLQIRSETEVFDAALKWINNKKSTRQQYLAEIMRSVRFTQMTPQEIHNRTEMQPAFLENKELTLMLLNAFKYHAFKCIDDPILQTIVKCEEKRNQDLNGSSIPDNFILALKELAQNACVLKSERSNASSNVAKFIHFNDNTYCEKCCMKGCLGKKEVCTCCFTQTVKNKCCTQRTCGDVVICEDLKSNSSIKCCEKTSIDSSCNNESSKITLRKLYEDCKEKYSGGLNENKWNYEYGNSCDNHHYDACHNFTNNNNNNKNYKSNRKQRKNKTNEQSPNVEKVPLFEIDN